MNFIHPVNALCNICIACKNIDNSMDVKKLYRNISVYMTLFFMVNIIRLINAIAEKKVKNTIEIHLALGINAVTTDINISIGIVVNDIFFIFTSFGIF